MSINKQILNAISDDAGAGCEVEIKKSWQEKSADKDNLPKILILEEGFPCFKAVHKMMGAEAGDEVVLVNPSEVMLLMRQVPQGKLVTLQEICRKIATQHQVKACCTLTSGIFTMTVANAAEEMKTEGKPSDLPWWRTLKSGGELNPKYPGGIAKQAELLEKEGHSIVHKGSKAFVKEYSQYLFSF